MMEFFTADMFNKIGVLAVLGSVALSIITDKLVWHTRLKAAEARADRWETVALEALTTGAQASVRAAEVAVGVVSQIPDPQRAREEAAKNP